MAYTPTAEEADAYAQLFRHATKNGQTQRLGGADAVGFFVTSGVPVATLKTIWSIASNGQKEMTSREFSTAMRLIALAQSGQTINDNTLDSTVGVKSNLPKFSGVELQAPAPQPQQQPQQQQQQPPYTVTPEARTQYEKLWQGLEKNPHTGLLEGKEAAGFLAKSQQNRDVLRQVWKMSDVTGDGMMDLTEFIIAMHLTMLAKKGFALPQTLPNELLQSAGGGSGSSQASNNLSALNASQVNFSALMGNEFSAPVLAPATSSYFPPPATPASPVSAYTSTPYTFTPELPQPPLVQDQVLSGQFARLNSESQFLSGERDRLTVALQDSTNKFQRDLDKLTALDGEVIKLRSEVQHLVQLLSNKRDAIGEQQDEIRSKLLEATVLTQQIALVQRGSN
ncbi:hypothetical protein BASA81_000868 [Batrachochytrium salamandrivorans]|nr:hypothetical protein BASA81_000868 [Batrachochytrium salamandrivorans]